MKNSEMISIIFKVLKDPKVIGTTIAMILVITFANFIVNYSKKHKTPKIKKPAAAPAPKKQEPTEPRVDMSEKDA